MKAETHTSLLNSWVKSRSSDFKRLHLRPELSVNAVAAQTSEGIHLDLDGDNAMARVTVWPKLIADFEAIDANTGEKIFWEHVEHVNLNHFDAWLRKVAAANRTEITENESIGQRDEMLQLTTLITKSYLSHNRLGAGDLPRLIQSIWQALSDPTLIMLQEQPVRGKRRLRRVIPTRAEQRARQRA